MKWPTLFFCGALTLLGSACEQHHVAELAQIEEEHEGAAEHGGHEQKSEEAAKTSPDAPGPKFFNH